MKILISTFTSTLILIVNISTAHTASSHTCGKDIAGGVEYRWCIDRPLVGNNDVLYYLHGGGGNETSWTTATDNLEIQKEWDFSHSKSPTVITVSFGASWLLTEVAKPDNPALFPIFTDDIMSHLESKLGTPVGKRLLKGESMGGFNASQLWLKKPNSFSRVALVCPGISTIGPYSSKMAIAEFLDRNKPYIDLARVNELLEWTKWEFPTVQSWVDHDPLALIQNGAKRSAELYVSCGEQDEYGFFEGAGKFSDLASVTGANVKWDPMAGGHCVSNAKAIADFLSR